MRFASAHLDAVVLLALNRLLPRVELLSLVDVLAAGAAGTTLLSSLPHKTEAPHDFGTTYVHLMLNGAIRRTGCCLSLGIFLRGILLCDEKHQAVSPELRVTLATESETCLGSKSGGKYCCGGSSGERTSRTVRPDTNSFSAPCSTPCARPWCPTGGSWGEAAGGKRRR